MPSRSAATGQTGVMARIEVSIDRLVIRLSAVERALAARRNDVVLSRQRITSALITEDPRVWLRGVRARGARMPRAFTPLRGLTVGVWRGQGSRDFALIRHGKPAVVLDFAGAAGAEYSTGNKPFDDFSRVILSTVHASRLISALRIDGNNAAFEVGV